MKPNVVTLCMNPALDITTDTDVVRPTDKLRCGPPRYDPGGGGINVAHVLESEEISYFPGRKECVCPSTARNERQSTKCNR